MKKRLGLILAGLIFCVGSQNAFAENSRVENSDKSLIARITMAEAEGESEYGKRLVIDSILNRVDSEYFPNTVSGVVYQSGQFTCVDNGRLSRCGVDDDILRLVEEEIEYRTNNVVVYFTANRYGKYGYPIVNEGNHYFSAYE